LNCNSINLFEYALVLFTTTWISNRYTRFSKVATTPQSTLWIQILRFDKPSPTDRKRTNGIGVPICYRGKSPSALTEANRIKIPPGAEIPAEYCEGSNTVTG